MTETFQFSQLVVLLIVSNTTLKMSSTRLNYTEEAMALAIAACQNENLSKRAAAKRYKVPRTTLADKLAGRTPVQRRMGPLPFLNRD